MNIVFCCVTHNPMSLVRFDLLELTMKSARIAFGDAALVLVDNASTDGSEAAQLELASSVCAKYVRADRGYLGAFEHWSTEPNHTPGRGRTAAWKALQAPFMVKNPAETIVVMSDDDMEWLPTAGHWLKEFWSSKSRKYDDSEIAILCALLEPEWKWNEIRGMFDTGTVRVLVRDSCPGAAWTFPMEYGKDIFPIPMTFGYDHKTCMKLKGSGLSVAQIDLALHRGWEASSHGNDAVLHGKPVDRAKWGL